MLDAGTLQDEDVDGAVNGGGVDDGNSDGSQGGDQDFLVVNERTKYRTVEDARKAFDESGKRISSLSQWEKIGKEVGITDPQHIKALVTEVLEARKAKEAASKQKVTADDDDVQLTPEQKAQQKSAKKWLKENADELGYVSKEKLDEIAKKLEALEGSSKATQEDRANARIEQGRGTLQTLLKEAKLPTDNPKLARLIENDVRVFIEGDKDREQIFWSGSPAEVRALLKEALDDIAPVFQSFKAASNANYASNKSTSVKTASKQLPRSGSAPARDAAPTGKKKSDPWADANRRVQAMLDESQAGAE